MPRINLLFTMIVLCIASILPASSAAAASKEDDTAAAAKVVLAFEKAVQEFDFDRADSLMTPDARWIEDSFPNPAEPTLRRAFQSFKDAKMRFNYHPQDVEVHVKGDVAWATVTLDSVWDGDTAAGKAINGGKSESRYIYVESEVLVRTPDGWKITLGHTSDLHADQVAKYFGISVPDYIPGESGVRLVGVVEGGVAGKAGFRNGDVLTEFGGMTVKSLPDFVRALMADFGGGKVMVTVMRGQEKITKELTL